LKFDQDPIVAGAAENRCHVTINTAWSFARSTDPVPQAASGKLKVRADDVPDHPEAWKECDATHLFIHKLATQCLHFTGVGVDREVLQMAIAIEWGARVNVQEHLVSPDLKA
jgi:hypothetical protein